MSYCQPADITTYSVGSRAVQGLSTAQLQGCCDRASAEMDSRGFAARYGLPLVTWDAEVTARCADLAAWYALRIRGESPEPAANRAIQDAAIDARQWLDDVAGRVIHPAIVDAGGAESLPDAVQTPSRGWAEWGNPNLSPPSSESEV